MSDLKALVLACTLKPSPNPSHNSSTDLPTRHTDIASLPSGTR